MAEGLRVVRGPDWKWGEQDGGFSHLGTIVRLEAMDRSVINSNTVFVRWDSGQIANYRVGADGAYDLLEFSLAQIGVVHSGISCKGCKAKDIIGFRWKCFECFEYNLCSQCYMNNEHNLSHIFVRCRFPKSIDVTVPPRSKSRRVECMGFFPGATVARGSDWIWINQDGGEGNRGLILEITSKEGSNLWQSWCKVTWNRGGTNDYRIGHKGFVDLKCIEPASGGYIYPEHLPKVGNEDLISRVNKNSHRKTINGFKAGDKVEVLLDLEVFRDIQMETSVWDDQLVLCIGQTGVVKRLTEDGQVLVQFEGFDNPWCINPMALSQQSPRLQKGDVVRLLSEEPRVIALQEGHGDWVDEMKNILGRELKVVKVYDDGDVKAKALGASWIFNPLCLTFVSNGQWESSESEADGEDEGSLVPLSPVDPPVHLTLDDVLSNDALPNAPTQHPEEELVGRRFADNNVRLLEEDGRNTQNAANQSQNEIGNTIHSAVENDRLDIAADLIKTGADIDAVNLKLQTPLHIAVQNGNSRFIKFLIDEECDVNLRDDASDTPLHSAIKLCANKDIIRLLTGAPGADLAVRNEKGMNALHFAVLIQNLIAVREIVESHPELVNKEKVGDSTALHMAAFTGSAAISEILIKQGGADLEEVNKKGHTPLLLSICKAQTPVIEILVENGADVNRSDKDGNSCLHLVLKNVKLGSSSSVPRDIENAPKIFQIFNQTPEIGHRGWLSVACYLVSKGADLSRCNSAGVSAIDLADDESICSSLLNYVPSQPSTPDVTDVPGGPTTMNNAAWDSVTRRDSETTNNAARQSVTRWDSETVCRLCHKKDAKIMFIDCSHGSCFKCSRGLTVCHICGRVIVLKVEMFHDHT